MKWDLTKLFKTQADFDKEYQEVYQKIGEISQYEGHLGEQEAFVNFLKLTREFEERASKLYLYAHLGSDLNKKDVEKANLVNKCMVLIQALNQASSYSDPELLALGEEKVLGNLTDEVMEFKFSLEKLFHENEHVLDKASERLLSFINPALNPGGELYSMLVVADGVQKEAELSTGKTLVTQGNWSGLIEDSKNASDRQKIFETIYEVYDQHKNTLASIYNNIMESKKSIMKSRNYNSILDVHLFRNNIPTSVYETLVDVASHENSSLKKYLKLRKEYLGLDEYHTYDRFMKLASSTKKYSFEEAKEIFFKSVEKFPEDFQAKAHSALEEGYVDVYEQPGKRTGAYSSGVANQHPFILLNYTNTLEDVFTVAHESGHSMHSLFAGEAQPVMTQDYTIFVAEIASTFNEHNLLDYLMNSGMLSHEEKIMLLQKAIDSIMSTFYRQTLFADYELRASRLKEQNQPLNHEVLSKIMIDLYEQYYGLDITKEKVKQYVWAYIPHLFYTPFYVYQYATSFAASFKLYQDVKENKPGAYERYTNLLKAGGSKYPVDEAKDAGVDFTKRETFEAVVKRMDELVELLEAELKK